MNTSTVTAKGQTTIPKAVRRALNLKAGDRVIFVVEGERAILIPAHRRSMTELRGALATTEPYLGHESVRREVARRRGEALSSEAAG